MARRHSRVRYVDESDDSDAEYPPAITIPISMNPSHHRHYSGDRRAYRESDLLSVPGGARQRASSLGQAPQPSVVIDMGGRNSSGSRSRSRERRRPHSRRRSKDSEEEIVVLREHHRDRSYSGGTNQSGDRLDYSTRRKLDKLEAMEREEEEEQLRRELKRKLKLEALEAEEKERLRKVEEKEKRKRYVEDWKREELEKKEKEKMKKEEEDKAFEERVKRQFLAAGYSEAHIESILREKRKKVEDNTLAMDLSRPTWIKVNRKHLVPETLEAYNLPWDFYEVLEPSSTRFPSTNRRFPKQKDTDYLIIKKYVSQSLQDELFEHTRTLKARKMITGPEIKRDVVTTLKVGGSKDKMYLVRNKSQTRSKSKERRWS